MLEFLSNLSWPAAFAAIGSLITIILGIFGYLAQLRKKESNTPIDDSQDIEIDKLHTRISEVKDNVAEISGDMKAFRTALRGLQKQLRDHEHRDIEDFKAIEAKFDKLMDIIVQILQDDKL